MFNNKIRKIDISTREVSTFAGSGSYSKLDGIGMNASFQNPTAITSNGNHLFVIETGSKTIRRIDILSQEVKTVASSAFGTSDGITSLG